MNFRCESQDELEQLNKSTSQNSFEKNNLYPQNESYCENSRSLIVISILPVF